MSARWRDDAEIQYARAVLIVEHGAAAVAFLRNLVRRARSSRRQVPHEPAPSRR
jgi:hypothetical protein